MAVKDLLITWKFSDEVIGHFIAQEIEVDQFNNLTEEDLKILIPNFGHRRKFQNNLKIYLDKIAQQFSKIDLNIQQATQREDIANVSKKQKIDTELHSVEEINIEQQRSIETSSVIELQCNEDIVVEDICPTSPSASSTSASTGYDVIFLTNNTTAQKKKYTTDNEHVDNEYDLKSILQKSEDGLLLLGLYKNEKTLNNDLRNKLAKIIVSYELSPNINNTISSERASFLSDQIIKLFPTEDKSVWYIKNKKGESQGRGKILTKYYCTRRKLIKAGLLNVKAATDFTHNQINDEENDNYEEHMLWLQNNSKPWNIVID
ncbi:PREDICTED: uncharacterized protein LOC105450638 [Wasmannia auropunctata]|uniref:uncharacterized protein LOC105450638 n=1 Tax=Wasmannia auropunctata TaxID=64793 RepID=UPI0005F074DB|nr:PREDICTED: uncharacterized protein LOC105450638 [Wasmannia auropunctata]